MSIRTGYGLMIIGFLQVLGTAHDWRITDTGMAYAQEYFLGVAIILTGILVIAIHSAAETIAKAKKD